MVESTIQPAEIYIDKIHGGRAKLLCHWDITTSTREGQTVYRYEEAVLWWTFPYMDTDGVTVLDNLPAIEKFMQENKADILNYAKGTKITLDSKNKSKPATEAEKVKVDMEEKEFTVMGK